MCWHGNDLWLNPYHLIYFYLEFTVIFDCGFCNPRSVCLGDSDERCKAVSRSQEQ